MDRHTTRRKRVLLRRRPNTTSRVGAGTSISPTSAGAASSSPIAIAPTSTVMELLQCGTDLGALIFDTPSSSAPLPEGDVKESEKMAARRVRQLVDPLEALIQAVEHRQRNPREALRAVVRLMRLGLRQPIEDRLALRARLRGDQRPPEALLGDEAYHRLVSSRAVPLEAMVDGLRTLAYTSVKLRVELLSLLLRTRLEEAMKQVDARRPHLTQDEAELETAALLVTETLLSDFVESYTNVVRYFSMSRAASLQLTPNPGADAAGGLGSSAAAHPTVAAVEATLLRQYYEMSDWVLLVESTTEVSPVSLSQVARAELHLPKVKEAPSLRRGARRRAGGGGAALAAEDIGTLVVEVRRPTTGTPWGVLFTETGRMLDVDVSMRVGPMARQVHDLLRMTVGGARIAAVNGQPIRPPLPEDSASTYARHVLETVHAATVSSRRMVLEATSPAFTAAAMYQRPQELLFYVPSQGGEGAAGQRACFVLHRHHPETIPWSFAVEDTPEPAPPATTTTSTPTAGAVGQQQRSCLRWHPPHPEDPRAVRLSDAGRRFVRAFEGRLRLFSVNGVEVLTAAQAAALMRTASTILLQLVVLPAEAAVSRSAAASPPPDAATSGRGPSAKTKKRGGKSAVDNGTPSASSQRRRRRRTPQRSNHNIATTPPAATTTAAALPDGVTGLGELAVETIRALRAAKEEKKAMEPVEEAPPSAPVGNNNNNMKKSSTTPSTKTTARQSPRSSSSKRKSSARSKGDKGNDTTPLAEAEAEAEAEARVTRQASRARRPKRGEAATLDADEGPSDILAALEEDGGGEKEVQEKSLETTTTTASSSSSKEEAAAKTATPGRRRLRNRSQSPSSKPAEDASATTKMDTKKKPPPPPKGKIEPCVFENNVRIIDFSETEMTIERPSKSLPWGLPIEKRPASGDGADGSNRTALQLAQLPPVPPTHRSHPYITQFTSRGEWPIAKINGVPATDPNKAIKLMRSVTRMTLRFRR